MTSPRPSPPIPPTMIAPSQRRPGIWRGGIVQIMVTRACDLACYHCSQGSNLAGKPAVMTPDQFDAACTSLRGYFGIVGVFGGNPCLHPQFAELCTILRSHFHFEQRGLWSNHPRGKGAHCRITFDPKHSNLNVHLSEDARAEFARDWPESTPYLKGTAEDSLHGSPWVSMTDVGLDEPTRLELIGKCDINQHWSAAIGHVPGRGLRAFFCEIAYAQSALHADNDDWNDTGQPMPDTGIEVAPDWWRRPMADFAAQVATHCHHCGIPMRRPGQLAVDGKREEFSATHWHIARSKKRDRPIEFIAVDQLRSSARPATDYLPNITPRRPTP